MSELETIDNAIETLNAGGVSVYSSLVGDDFETKKQLLSATTNSLPVRDILGKTIQLKNVVVQGIEMENEDTGEVQQVPRVILLDDKGNAYHAISKPVFNAVKNFIGILGQPATWEKPVPVKVVQEGSGNRKYFVLRLA